VTSTYIETGPQIRVFDSAVRAHDALPLGTYKVHFDPKAGFSLLRIPDLVVGTERIYGHRERKVEKVFKAYRRAQRKLGVLLSGDKGIGKSQFARMLAERSIDEGIPVVLVTEDAEGIADFLDTLDECLVIFDEFEKVFSSGRNQYEGRNRQNQFLPLFDGISSARRIYCVTVNDLADVSSYILNRPGRFHYHMRFEYPGPDEVREYLTEQAPAALAEEVENVANFSLRVNLNYDHLEAIAFELNDPNAQFAEIVQDLNIKPVEPSLYRVEAKFDNGVVLSDEVPLNLFERSGDGRTIELSNASKSFYFSFIPKDLWYSDDGVIHIPVDKLTPCDDDDDYFDEPPLSVTLTLVGQASFAFDGF
jgi:hypothetical protein